MSDNANHSDRAADLAKQAVLIAILAARSVDDLDAPIASAVDPLPETQRLEVMSHVAGALSQILVMLRAGVPGVSEGLDNAAALYVAESIIDASIRRNDD